VQLNDEASPEAMAKYAIAEMIVVSVEIVWKMRREIGVFHDSNAKRAETMTINTKTTQRVRCPSWPATWNLGASGMTVGTGPISGGWV
jgi:hypothetical protein